MSNKKDILIAPLEENLLDQNGNSFSATGNYEFLEDDVVGKYVKIANQGQLVIKNPEFAVGTGDFTLDFWVKISGEGAVVSTMPVNGCGLAIWAKNSVSLGSNYLVGQGAAASGQIEIPVRYNPVGEWIHYAIVRKDAILYGFANGVLEGTLTSVQNVVDETLHINGLYVNYYMGEENCYKNVRFSNYARWTADFTPPKGIDDDGGDQPPTDPVIDMKLHVLLKIDQTVDLTGYMHPVGANPPTLVWSSEDDAIASVDQNGKVTGGAVGKTRIFVQTQDGSWSAFARIKVIGEGEDELLLSVLLEVGESCILFPEFDPEEAATAVLWSSSDATIATVNPVGMVTGIAPGLVTITAKTADNKLTDAMYVTVIADKVQG